MLGGHSLIITLLSHGDKMRQSFKVFIVTGVAAFFFILIGSAVQAQSFSTTESRDATTVFPPGQITVTVSLDDSIEVMTPLLVSSVSPTVPARLNLIGSAFAIQARNASVTRPMTVWVHYTPLAQMDERQLVIAYYDPTADKWLPLPTTIDSANHVAMATAEQADTYALVLLPAVAMPPSSAIIVDDLAAGFVRYGSPAGWHSVSGAADHYYLGHMYWTSSTYSTVDNYAIWTPALSAGSYQVYAFIDWDNATTQNARYQIVHNGQTTVFPVDQNSHYAEWVNLGTYSFGSVSSSNYVRLDDVTSETHLSKRIGFDAMAFVPNKVYLPIVMKNSWTPPPQPAPKDFSGMHLGNRNNEAWTDDMLRPFDPAKGGAWPKIAVALSHQLFTVNRDANCHITSVDIKPTGQSLYDYLKRATQQNNTMVIVRIYPSPGNFEESIDPNWPNPQTRPPTRTLISQVGIHPDPAHWTQCQGYEQERFRSVDDIGDEILAIQRYVHDRGWDVFGFEPANEPNAEWFANPANPDPPKPAHYNRESWPAMDPYFANLYDYVHANAGSLTIRVFTPPMAQGANAETGNTGAVQGGCQPFGDGTWSGYGEMPLTFNSGSPKNDGYSWHNYFIQGKESWATCPDGQHVSLYFPEPMSSNIQYHRRSAIISEVDLAPPQMQWENPVTDKDVQADMAAASIQKFLHDDYAVEYAAVWLLNDNNFTSSEYPKHAWSEAYDSFKGIRAWFIKWWYGSEYP
jgi:hypothetical protein